MRHVILWLLASIAIPCYAANFTLSTNAFVDTGATPILYTCDGKDVSPELSWTNAPANTKSYALLFADPDAPGGLFYHWVVYNIPATMKTLAEGVKLPASVGVGTNSFGKAQYNGPCPPQGAAHTYHFTLYALDGTLTLPEHANGNTVAEALGNHVLGKATLTTVYAKWSSP